jgi:hypothetical protein
MEPEIGHRSDFFDHAGLGEKMVGAIHEFEHRPIQHFAAGVAVVIDVGGVFATDDHQSGCLHMLKEVLREVRATTPRNHRAHQRRAIRGGNHRSGRPGARSEQADAQVAGVWIFGEPIDDGGQPTGDAGDVGGILQSDGIRRVLIRISEVREEDREAFLQQRAGDKPIARTEATSAGPMSENDDGFGVGRDFQDAIDDHFFSFNFDSQWFGEWIHGGESSFIR